MVISSCLRIASDESIFKTLMEDVADTSIGCDALLILQPVGQLSVGSSLTVPRIVGEVVNGWRVALFRGR